MAKGKKAKKPKGPDLSKMTEEERIAYLEQKALEEQMEKQKKETMMRQFMQHKLEAEERFSTVNHKKFNNQWLQIMREIKSKDLKRDIEILSQSFERIVDRKDSVIKTLVRNLNESEEQYNIALRSHTDAIETLLALQSSSLNRLENNFNLEVSDLKTEFNSEDQCVNINYKKQLDDLKNIFFSVDHFIETKKAEINLDFTERADGLKGKSLEDKHSLRLALETKVNSLWSEFRDLQKKYNLLTDERKVNFESLKVRDEKCIEEVESQMKRINGLNEQIQAVRQSMATVAREYETKNKRLKTEYDNLVKYLQTLKKESAALREKHNEKLLILANDSEETIKKMEQLQDKAKKILKLAERCRALETEEEKVLPFYESSLNAQEELALKEALQSLPNKSADDEEALFSSTLNKFKPLENFWKRFNKVQLERIGLMKSQEFLKQQNMQLRGLVKQFVDGLRVTDDCVMKSKELLGAVKIVPLVRIQEVKR